MIWAGVSAGNFAVYLKGLAKTFQFYGNNLPQCLNNNSPSDQICLIIYTVPVPAQTWCVLLYFSILSRVLKMYVQGKKAKRGRKDFSCQMIQNSA